MNMQKRQVLLSEGKKGRMDNGLHNLLYAKLFPHLRRDLLGRLQQNLFRMQRYLQRLFRMLRNLFG